MFENNNKFVQASWLQYKIDTYGKYYFNGFQKYVKSKFIVQEYQNKHYYSKQIQTLLFLIDIDTIILNRQFNQFRNSQIYRLKHIFVQNHIFQGLNKNQIRTKQELNKNQNNKNQMNKIYLNSSKKIISYKDDKGKAKKISRKTKQYINHSDYPNKSHKQQNLRDSSQQKSKTQQIDESNKRTTKMRQKINKQNKVIEKQQIIYFATKNSENKSSCIKQKQQQRSIVSKQNETKQLTNETTLLQCPSSQPHLQTIYLQKQQLSQKNIQLSLFRVSNQQQQDRIKNLERIIQQKDLEISKLKDRESSMIKEICNINCQNAATYHGNLQYQQLRDDSKRLLKMLQNTHEYQTFANLALDHGSIRFLHSVNKNNKTQLDLLPSSQSQNPIHFCSCNKQFYQQSDLWVPQKVYSLANQFLKSRNYSLTSSQLQLMLYQLNRIWQEREKKIINSSDSRHAHELSNYKRKIQQIKHAGYQQVLTKLQ